jgi:hypothetical protein
MRSAAHPPSPHLLFFPQDSPEAGGEREEEQAFLVSLYKFMKERHTPIERVPHLGFKQSASRGFRQGGGPGRGPQQARAMGQAPLLWGVPRNCQPIKVVNRKDASWQAQGWKWAEPLDHQSIGPACPSMILTCLGVWGASSCCWGTSHLLQTLTACSVPLSSS